MELVEVVGVPQLTPSSFFFLPSLLFFFFHPPILVSVNLSFLLGSVRFLLVCFLGWCSFFFFFIHSFILSFFLSFFLFITLVHARACGSSN